jgi:hypothetical protein
MLKLKYSMPCFCTQILTMDKPLSHIKLDFENGGK